MNQNNSIVSTSLIQNPQLQEPKQVQPAAALPLVLKLCQGLNAEKIDYCHWKSNEAITRSASGDNDLDLLISRAHAERFTKILFELGFREAQEDDKKRLPGILNYYGYDAGVNRIIHVHLHYQLVLGNDLSKNYHIPIEQPYLDSARQAELFRVPASEFELVIFVLRMVLKHSTWDSILMGQGRLSPSECRELKYLATDENLAKVDSVLLYLPYINQDLFNSCLQSLQPRCSLKKRIRTGEQLQEALEACARRPHALDIFAKFLRWVWLFVHIGIFRQKLRRRLANGGLLIAVVGGDGSGKTTAIEDLYLWLSQNFDVMKLHMGKPVWSWTTIIMWGVLKIARMLGVYSRSEYLSEEEAKFPGYPWLIRRVCVAHDRYLTYLKARRFSSNGGLVVVDRYSLPNLAMDAPQCRRTAKDFNKSNWFLKWLMRIEEGYYRKIARPDVLIVLKVDPEIAVKRKPEESIVSVRARSKLVWEFDWNNAPAHVLDASLSKNEVLDQIKSLVWEHL
jgi:thymidylate kinase